MTELATPVGRTRATTGAGTAEARLRGRFRGGLLRGYEEARRVWNGAMGCWGCASG